jgi:hypothetical protein
MSGPYAMDQSWNLQSQFPQGQQIQLEEEYYMQSQGQEHPHHHPQLHLHTASYPPVTGGPYRAFPNTFAPDSMGQQPTRSQSYGNNGMNGRVLNHNTEDFYGNSMSQAHDVPFHPTPTSANGFYSNTSIAYQQSYTPGSSSPGNGSAIGLPDHINGTSQSDGGITPFTSSPMSLPVNFDSQVPQPQLQNQQQQSQMGSSNGGGLEQEFARQPKRSRGPDGEDFAFNVDVGMDHEINEGHDGKEVKSKP